MEVQTPSCAPPKADKSREKISSHDVNIALKLSSQKMSICVMVPKFWRKPIQMLIPVKASLAPWPN